MSMVRAAATVEPTRYCDWRVEVKPECYGYNELRLMLTIALCAYALLALFTWSIVLYRRCWLAIELRDSAGRVRAAEVIMSVLGVFDLLQLAYLSVLWVQIPASWGLLEFLRGVPYSVAFSGMYYYVYTMIRVVPVATRPVDDISPRGRATFAVVSSVILSYLFTIISIASGAFYDYELDFIYRTGTRHQMLKAYYFLWALLSVTAIFVCTYYGGKLIRLLQQSIGSVEQTALIEADVTESAYLLTRRSALHKIRSTVFAGVAVLVFVGGTALAHSFWRIDIMTNVHLSRVAYVLSMLTAPAFLLIHHAAYLYGMRRNYH